MRARLNSQLRHSSDNDSLEALKHLLRCKAGLLWARGVSEIDQSNALNPLMMPGGL